MSDPAPPVPSDSEPEPEHTSYDGNCHCGAVRFTVKIPSLTSHKVMSCNCSLCTRNGYLMIYPHRKDVVFHSGYDDNNLTTRMSSYPVLHTNVHRFCSTCGGSVMGESIGEDDRVAINVRMIKDINVDELKLQYYDGRATKPAYDIGKLTPGSSENSSAPTTLTATASGLTPYPANCHCGAVRYTVHIPSITQTNPDTDTDKPQSQVQGKVNNCNCSICTRNGYLFVYPERGLDQVAFHAGYDDHLRSYTFGVKSRAHKFCSTCGSSILYEKGQETLGINVRMFRDVDLSKYQYTYFDGKTKLKPEYAL